MTLFTPRETSIFTSQLFQGTCNEGIVVYEPSFCKIRRPSWKHDRFLALPATSLCICANVEKPRSFLMRPPMHVPGDGGSKHRYRDSHQKNNQNRNHLRATNVTTPVSRRPTLQGTTLLNLQHRDGSRLRDQNEDTKQKAQYLYTATQHLTQHRDRNASDNSMNTTPADLQITAETEVLHVTP